MKKLLATAMTLIMILGLSITALAAVTFDSATGKGFVGKGDVQTAFGWNNNQAQSNAKAVTFNYVEKVKYAVTVEFTTGNEKVQKVHEVTKKVTSAMECNVAYDARLKNQYTGYNLLGFRGMPVVEGYTPAIGEKLVTPQSDNELPSDHVIVGVEILSSTGGLYVNYSGNSVLLPQVPIQ